MPPIKRISLEQRLARAFEEKHELYLTDADIIGVNRSTATGIIIRCVREERIAERPCARQNKLKEAA